MRLRRVLWLYSMFACLALAGLMVAVGAASGRLRTASAEASESLQRAAELAEAQREVVVLMEEHQRMRRADLASEEAIQISAEVQVEKDLLGQLDAGRAAAEQTQRATKAAYEAHMRRLIPLIALLILHLVGAMLFWPRRA